MWDRPCILFGLANDNKLIADLDSVTLLDRQASADFIGPGCAVIETVSSPFWNGHDALSLCSDRAGMARACAAWSSLPPGVMHPAQYRWTPTAARAPITALPLASTLERARVSMLALYQRQLPFRKVAFDPDLPVIGVAPSGDGCVAVISRSGRNAVGLAADGSVRWRSGTGVFEEPVANECSA